MSTTLSADAQTRDVVGKNVNSLRRDGFIPAHIFSKGKESLTIQLNERVAQKLYSSAGHTHAIELSLDGKKHLVLIKDADFHPTKQLLRHISFHEIKKGEKVHAEVPIHLTGNSLAERAGLLTVQVLDSVEVEAEATQIPESFEIDKSHLEKDEDSLSVSDIVVPEGVIILTDLSRTIVNVVVPRAEVESVAEEEAAEATTETVDATSAEKTEE